MQVDQDVIKRAKRRYKRKLMTAAFKRMTENNADNIFETSKMISIK